MLDMAGMAAGVATGIAAEQGNRFIRSVAPEEEISNKDIHGMLGEMRDFLRIIAEGSPRFTPNENDPVPIFPYPQQYRIPTYDRLHLSIFLSSGVSGSSGAFLPAVSSARFHVEIPGAGVYIATLAPGWNQVDFPPQTAISSADGNTYNVLLSFRDDPIGTALTEGQPLSIAGINGQAATATNPIPTFAAIGTPLVQSSGPLGAGVGGSAALSAVAGKTNYIKGFCVSNQAPAANVGGVVTLQGLSGGTLHFQYNETTALGGLLTVLFGDGFPASGSNQAITANLPTIASGGAGAVVIWGYQL